MTEKKKNIIESKTKYVKWLVESAITEVLLEQAEVPVQQPPVQAAPAPAPGAPAPSADPSMEQPAEQAPAPQVMSLDDMIEKLNVVRGGRSFTDPEVYTKLGETYKSFTDQQKADFGAALSKIVEVVINPQEAGQPDQTQQQQQQPMSGVGMPPADMGAATAGQAPAGAPIA